MSWILRLWTRWFTTGRYQHKQLAEPQGFFDKAAKPENGQLSEINQNAFPRRLLNDFFSCGWAHKSLSSEVKSSMLLIGSFTPYHSQPDCQQLLESTLDMFAAKMILGNFKIQSHIPFPIISFIESFSSLFPFHVWHAYWRYAKVCLRRNLSWIMWHWVFQAGALHLG